MSVYSDYEYRKRTAALRKRTQMSDGVCVHCHQPFDWSLHYTDKMSFTADHEVPLSLGGALLGPILPAHR